MHYTTALRLSYQLNFNIRIPTTGMKPFWYPICQKVSWKPSAMKCTLTISQNTASNALLLKSQLFLRNEKKNDLVWDYFMGKFLNKANS